MISSVALSLSMKLIFTVSVGEPEKTSNVIEALSSVNINQHLSVVVSGVFVKTKGKRLDESGYYVRTIQASRVVCHFISSQLGSSWSALPTDGSFVS